MDRLNAIEVLLAVVDAGSLSAGGRKLNSPLTSVSRKVSELERHLGTRLLIRTSRNVQLTDAGREYVDTIRQLVAQIKDAELRASGEYQTPRGELRVTVPPEFGRFVAIPLGYEFLAEHPEVALNILVRTRLMDLTEERVDVGIRIGHLADSSLFAVKVGHIRMVTCASPDYLERKGLPEAPGKLAEHDAVWFGNASPAWGGEDWIRTVPDGSMLPEGHPAVRVYADDLFAARVAVLKGFGLARLPNYLISDDLRSGHLTAILDDYRPDPVPVHIIYVKQGLMPVKVRAFIDWMTPRLRQALKEVEDTCAAATQRLRSRKSVTVVGTGRA